MCKALRKTRSGALPQEALDLERVVNTLVVADSAKPGSGLTGVSLFHRPPDDEIDDSVFAKSLSMRTADQLALNKTGWSKVAFEESLNQHEGPMRPSANMGEMVWHLKTMVSVSRKMH